MKKKISLAAVVIFMVFINLTISLQYTSSNKLVSISFLESLADGNIEVRDPNPGDIYLPNSETPDEWSLSAILDYFFGAESN